jgi:putative membrane protein
MHRSILLAAAASMTVAGCAMNGDAGMNGMGGRTGMSAGMAGDMTPTNRTGYVQMAASSDMYEIQSSQIALSKAQNPLVRQFAQMMVNDHTNTTQQLMAASQAAGLPPMSPMMMPMHARMVAELQAAPSGAGFDRIYARQQLMAHQQALALHSNYAARGDTPALRSVAAAATPVVRRHLDLVRRWPG